MNNILDSHTALTKELFVGYCGIDPRHFFILSDWIHEVTKMLKLRGITTNLALQLFNSYCATAVVKPVKDEYQLFICAACQIAAYLCEIYPLDMSDLIFVAAESFSLTLFNKAISTLCVTLSGKLMIPCPISYLNEISMIDTNFQELERRTTEQVLGVCSLMADSYDYQPHQLAAAAIFFVRIANAHKIIAPTTSPIASAIRSVASTTPVIKKNIPKKLSPTREISPEDVLLSANVSSEEEAPKLSQIGRSPVKNREVIVNNVESSSSSEEEAPMKSVLRREPISNVPSKTAGKVPMKVTIKTRAEIARETREAKAAAKEAKIAAKEAARKVKEEAARPPKPTKEKINESINGPRSTLIVDGRSYRYHQVNMEQLIDLIYKFLRTEFKKVDRRKESRRRFPLAYEVFDLYVPTGRTWPKENPKGVQTLTPGKQTEVNITRAGSKLGEGAYGKVYKKKIGKSTVAIKQQQQSPSSMLEIAIMRTLRHKNIQQIKEFSFQGDEVFIQMSVQKNSLSGAIYTTHTFLDGVRARDAIWYHGLTPFKVIDLPLRRYYGKQLMAGLAYLHDNGVIHADLKPANILITASNTLKIADFGLSQIFVPSQFDFSRRDWNVVTLPYRDINIIKKSVAAIDNIPQYTFDIDIWAAAVTLMELETGSCPFGGFNTEAETLVSIENLLGKYTKPTHHLGTEYYLTNINSLPFKVLLLQMLDYDSSRRITSHQAHALL